MTSLTIPLPDAPAACNRARNGSTGERVRVYLDPASLGRIDYLRRFVIRAFGAHLSTTMVVRLALQLAETRIKDVDTEDLPRLLLAAKDGR